MLAASADPFLSALRASKLLPPARLDEVEAEAAFAGPDPDQLARELVGQGDLTPYQAAELLAGRATGLVLGQYRILDRLGAGGMAQVYKAEHVLMKRVVALKVLASHTAAGPDFADPGRFHREVRAAAQLSHPNVVTAFDAAEADGVLFLVMEYVEGTDLGRLVAEHGPLPVVEACECVSQAA